MKNTSIFQLSPSSEYFNFCRIYLRQVMMVLYVCSVIDAYVLLFVQTMLRFCNCCPPQTFGLFSVPTATVALPQTMNTQILTYVTPICTIDPPLQILVTLRPAAKPSGVGAAEQDHGARSTHLAKSRLVKFLHQKMGFCRL